jgi:ABC-type nickel/cobalt efflux system permease component RcnA
VATPCFRILAVCALWLVPAAALAHPVPRMHHDRTLLIRLEPTAIVIEYTLALDDWTLLRDLQPFAGQLDFASGAKALYPGYEKIYGPLLAQGMAIEVDGKEVAAKFAGCAFSKESDHLRYVFTFRAPFAADATRREHTARITDSTFAYQPGEFRLGVRGEAGAAITQCNAPDHPNKGRAYALHEYDEQEQEQLRTARVSFRILPLAWQRLAEWWSGGEEASGMLEWIAWGEFIPQPAEATPAFGLGLTSPLADSWLRLARLISGVAAAPPSPSPSRPTAPAADDPLGSFSVYRLLQADVGIVLLLLLAYVFGAVHALQPGHGKTMVAAYLVGARGTVAHAVFLGIITTLTHTSMVFVLAIAVPLLVGDEGMEAQIHFGLSLGCGILVTVFALWLVSRRLSGQADHVHLFGGHHHHHGDGGHHHHHLPAGEKVGWWALFTMGVTGGLVPCVDALALLAATWIMKKLWLGFWLTLAFSLGLATVLVLLGILVVKFRRFADSKWGNGRFVRALPLLSALATLALGIWMCLDVVKQRPTTSRTTDRPTPAMEVADCDLKRPS